MRQPLAEMSVLGRTPRTSPRFTWKLGWRMLSSWSSMFVSSSGIFDKFVLHKIVVCGSWKLKIWNSKTATKNGLRNRHGWICWMFSSNCWWQKSRNISIISRVFYTSCWWWSIPVMNRILRGSAARVPCLLWGCAGQQHQQHQQPTTTNNNQQQPATTTTTTSNNQ